MSLPNQKTKFRILVVDDTKTDRDLFKFFISQAGYEVDVAGNGEEALQLLAKKEFDLALCDYQMPTMDGLEFLTKLRTNEAYNHLVVIIITSDESEATKVKLLKAGANDFIHKGCSANEILARIKTHLDAQAGYFNRQILSMAGKLASELNEPLGVMVAALDVLKLKVQQDIASNKKSEYETVLTALNKEAEAMMRITEHLRKLGMDTTKVYKTEKRF